MIRTLLSSVAAAGLLALPFATGCGSNDGSVFADQNEVGFWIEPSDTDIVAGELVTLTAHSRNVIGRDAEVEWTSTAGKIDTEANGRVARVKFDEPGAYTVTGRLILDGRVIQEDSINIEVDRVS